MRLFLLILACFQAAAATLNVPGTYATIAAAHTAASAGDTIMVNGATYTGAERVAISKDGTSSAYISFLGTNSPVVRGFDLSSGDYVNIIGFEITHNSSTYSRAITMNGTGSHIGIYNNYIHNTYGDQCVQSSGTYSYVIIRGNYINEVRWVVGVEIDCQRQAIGSANTSSFWLVEYNHIQRSGDFINLYGTDHIERNNYLHDYSDSYCPLANGAPGHANHTHSDMFQPGSDGLIANNKRCVYERNFMGDSTEANSHVHLFQDGNSGGGGGVTDTDLLVRGEVAFNIGDGFSGGFGTDNLSHYNNTAYQMGRGINGAVFYYNAAGDLNTLVYNNIISDDGIIVSGGAIQLAGTGSAAANNLGFNAGTEASYVSTSDPLFVNPASGTRDFHLQAGSPAIDAGKADIITITSGNGSGTSFDVNNGKLLCDGKGIAEGDIITTGGTTTRITGISGNTVTVADSVTWTTGQNVYWGTDTTPDIGAYPFGSAALTAATISQNGTTYTVTPTGDCRGVFFYVDGKPSTWDYTPPYQITSSGTVTAQAAALFAQNPPLVTATAGAPSTYAYVGNGATVGNGVTIQ